jgi:hypothetical protein
MTMSKIYKNKIIKIKILLKIAKKCTMNIDKSQIQKNWKKFVMLK